MSVYSKAAALFVALMSVIVIAWAPPVTADNLRQASSRIQLAKADDPASIPVSSLPSEAQETLRLIKQGGPFPYTKDGTTFGNREKRLPFKPKGYYKEYTVKTRGAHDRGARRIVAGAGGEYYYTDDHYNTFRLIVE